jgi:glycosyltransferase involved in cell wall biosynthesis
LIDLQTGISTGQSAEIMLLTNSLDNAPSGGRELLCKLNSDILEDLFADALVRCEVPKAKVRGLSATLSAFRGHIDGLNGDTIEHALQTLSRLNIKKLFVDGSGFGEFVRAAKRRMPHIEITTYFHNVEARFFLGSLRDARTLHALAVLLVNFLAERKSVRYSDNLVCLSERDSQSLRAIYGRGATHISPMAMHDRVNNSDFSGVGELREPYALFVGGGFYANRAGMEWYLEHVAPRISIKTCIVGGGLDQLKSSTQRNDKVIFTGHVDNLAHWYRNAQFVVAPIFDGSGMKTKVAEALMFGKAIIGTPEAFSGYEGMPRQAGWICTNADEFVAAIGSAQARIVDSFDPALRAIYDENYSYRAARSRLADILCTAEGHSAVTMNPYSR